MIFSPGNIFGEVLVTRYNTRPADFTMEAKSSSDTLKATATVVEDSKEGSTGAVKSPVVVPIQEEAVQDVRHIDLSWRSWVSFEFKVLMKGEISWRCTG